MGFLANITVSSVNIFKFVMNLSLCTVGWNRNCGEADKRTRKKEENRRQKEILDWQEAAVKTADKAQEDYNKHIKPNAKDCTYVYKTTNKVTNVQVENEVKCLEYELPAGNKVAPLLIVLSHYYDITKNEKGLRKIKEPPLAYENNQQNQIQSKEQQSKESIVEESNIALKIKLNIGGETIEFVLMPARERQIFLSFANKKFEKDEQHSYERIHTIFDDKDDKKMVAKVILDAIYATAGGNGKIDAFYKNSFYKNKVHIEVSQTKRLPPS